MEQEQTKALLEQRNKKKNGVKIVLFCFILIVCIGIYEYATFRTTYYRWEKNIEIPILVYHNIVDDEDEIKYDYMQTTQENFEKQMKGLIKLGYHFISYEDLLKYNNGEKALFKKSCIVTFDDGFKGVYENAYPIAKKYDIPITTFIINKNVGQKDTLSWEQLKEMEESKLVEVGSHSWDHADFRNLTKEEAVENVERSYQEIEEKLGKTFNKRIFTYPYGLYRPEQIEELKERGYIQNLTDNKINESKNLNLNGLHREYPLNDSVIKMIIKIQYRKIRYGNT